MLQVHELGGERKVEEGSNPFLIPERAAIAALKAERTYQDDEALREAEELGLLGNPIQAELSPTFRCPMDCSGCPDGRSLHRGDQKEVQITESKWYGIVDRLAELGVKYFLLIGGTVDGHRMTPKLMSYLLSKDQPIDIGWFTDGMPLIHWRTGKPNKLFEKLVQQGRMLDLTTHISVDYLNSQALEQHELPNPKYGYSGETDSSRKVKSVFGLILAKLLVERGARRVIINSAISALNIDQTMLIYDAAAKLQEYARSLNSPTVVLHTISPWVWRPYMVKGDLTDLDLNTILKDKHRAQLQEIGQYFLADTQQRIQLSRSRVAANSSGFIIGLPTFAISQDMPYKLGVEVLAIEPNGTMRMDPVFISARMLEHAQNSYGYRDRAIPNPFDQYNLERVITFPNLVQTTRGNFQWR